MVFKALIFALSCWDWNRVEGFVIMKAFMFKKTQNEGSLKVLCDINPAILPYRAYSLPSTDPPSFVVFHFSQPWG